MKKDYIISKDKAKIVYNIDGEGPLTILVHGLSDTKEIWIKNGWFDILKEHFTVVALDIRGNGESDSSLNPEFYSKENIINDINIIAEKCEFTQYNYFGHSYGATIGLELCKSDKNVKKAICAGTNFGDEFLKTIVLDIISDYEKFKDIKDRNIFDEDDLSKEDIEWLKTTNLDARIAKLKAMNKWTSVEPNDIKANLAIYSSENDIPIILDELKKDEEKIKKNNILLKVFKELNHSELTGKSKVVAPWVLDFLLK